MKAILHGIVIASIITTIEVSFPRLRCSMTFCVSGVALLSCGAVCVAAVAQFATSTLSERFSRSLGMAEDAPLLVRAKGTGRPRSGSVVGQRVRAACAWFSKRSAITYEDFAVGHREHEEIGDLRDELSDGVSGSTVAKWLADTRSGAGPKDDAEARVDALCKQLWNSVFARNSPCVSSWRQGCTCSASAAMPDGTGRCPAGPLAGGEAELAYPAMPSRAWICLGFQQSDPRTDMRAVGVPGLAYLVRLLSDSDHGYRERAMALAVGCARGNELPLAIAAFNAQYMLACHLHLLKSPPAFCPCCGSKIRETEYGSRSSQSYRGACLRGFLALLVQDPDAFFHLYAISILMLAKEWEQASPSSGALKRKGAYTDAASPLSSAATGAGSSGSAGGVTHVQPSPTGAGAIACLDLENGGVPVGDARLLQFPSMLNRVRQRIMAALAGSSSPSGASVEPYGESSLNAGRGYQQSAAAGAKLRRASLVMPAAASISIADLREQMLNWSARER